MIDTSKNYHSRLLDMSKAFDKPIEKLKGGHVDARYSNWVIWLLLAPFRDYSRFIKVQEGLKKVSAVSITPAIIPLATFITTLLQDINNIIELVGTLTVGFAIGYVMSILIYWPSLLDFYSVHFHTGAYKIFRRQEYNMFKMALLDKEGDFYFQGVYDYLGRMLTGNQEFTTLSQKLEEFFNKEKHQLETKFTLLQSQYNRLESRNEKQMTSIMKEYDSLIQVYDTVIDDLSHGSEYVIELIKDINNVLFRMKNGEFSSKDLNLVSGFTLHEKKGKELHKIEDVGTSGRTPKVIHIDDPAYQDWGVVKVIQENLEQPVINHPYENHTVVSVKMDIDMSKQWVYNFHFDSNNQKVNHLLVKNDIIDSREVYRLIHALCLLTDRMQRSNLKEANNNG